MNYWAGIGSRKTPNHICNIMYNIAAYMASQGWTLRSGGALQADTAFENGYKQIPNSKAEIYLPWRAYNHNLSDLHPIKYPFTDEETEFTAKFHPAWNKCGPSARLLHKRNTRIMLGMEALHGAQVTPSKFIICWTEGGQVTGGTGQALRIAEALDIPVINLGLATNTVELEYLVKKVDKYVDKYKTTGN